MLARFVSLMTAIFGVMVMAACAVLAQTNGGALATTIDGQVAEVFGSRFVLETSDGRILVEPVGMQQAVRLKVGERVSASGTLADRTLSARRIAGADGTVVHQSPPAVPLAVGSGDIHAVLASLQLTPVGPPVRKKHHTEVTARMPDGRTVYVSFDRFGRIDEIEDATHDKSKVAVARPLVRNDYLDVARRAGFDPLDEMETKKHHVELLARNRAGELLELHIDRAGTIYKQVWVR
jgi:hypothetical protein